MGTTHGAQLQVHAPDLTHAGNRGTRLPRAVKRAIDLAVAILGLLLLAPVMVAVAVAVRLDSPGPILFRQRRMGRDGRVFWILKLRSMVCGAENCLADLEPADKSLGGVLSSIRSDPRVTRVGGFLRRTSLDELPQLVNVLRGEMSLVGPRPLHLRDCERMSSLDLRSFEQRLLVPPGLTGLAQISGRRDLPAGDILKLDRLYVETWSVTGDLAILVRTFAIVLIGRGAF